MSHRTAAGRTRSGKALGIGPSYEAVAAAPTAQPGRRAAPAADARGGPSAAVATLRLTLGR